MRTIERSEAIAKLYEILEPELAGIVSNIENGIATTQNNYGAYMSAIDALNSETDLKKTVIGELLIMCGANKSGVQSAIGLLGG